MVTIAATRPVTLNQQFKLFRRQVFSPLKGWTAPPSTVLVVRAINPDAENILGSQSATLPSTAADYGRRYAHAGICSQVGLGPTGWQPELTNRCPMIIIPAESLPQPISLVELKGTALPRHVYLMP